MSTTVPEPLFWPGSLLGRGYGPLLEAAVAGGYRHMALDPLTAANLFAAGRRPSDVLTEAADRGISLAVLDGVSSWAPRRYEADTPPHLRARFDFASEACLDMAAALGMERVLAVGVFSMGAFGADELAESFGTFCRQAERYGLGVDLEFVPFWGITTLQEAWTIVSRTDCHNAALLIDTWHLLKGSCDVPGDIALIRSLPPRAISSIQIADAMRGSQAETLYAEGRRRLFPGHGELELPSVLTDIVQSSSSIRFVGLELFGDAIDTLSSEQAGRRTAAAARAIIADLYSGVVA